MQTAWRYALMEHIVRQTFTEGSKLSYA